MKPIVILGAGGFAREVRDVVESAGRAFSGFVVDPEFLLDGSEEVHDFQWLEGRSEVEVVCGVGAPELRYRLAAKTTRKFSECLRYPSATSGRETSFGEGSIVAAGVSVTCGVRVGRHVVLNLHATVGHDAVLEDFVAVMPGANISGNTSIGEGAYVGAGATIVPGVKVGAWSRIGSGCAVIRDVPPNATVVGVPGRIVNQRPDGWWRE